MKRTAQDGSEITRRKPLLPNLFKRIIEINDHKPLISHGLQQMLDLMAVYSNNKTNGDVGFGTDQTHYCNTQLLFTERIIVRSQPIKTPVRFQTDT